MAKHHISDFEVEAFRFKSWKRLHSGFCKMAIFEAKKRVAIWFAVRRFRCFVW